MPFGTRRVVGSIINAVHERRAEWDWRLRRRKSVKIGAATRSLPKVQELRWSTEDIMAQSSKHACSGLYSGARSIYELKLICFAFQPDHTRFDLESMYTLHCRIFRPAAHNIHLYGSDFSLRLCCERELLKLHR